MNNSSETKIKELKATLIQIIKYHGAYTGKKLKFNKAKQTTKKTKVVKKDVGKPLIIGTVEGNEEKTFDAELDVPELPPTHADNTAIEISYIFKLEVLTQVEYPITNYLLFRQFQTA